MNNNKLIKKNISLVTSITLIFSLIGPWIGLIEGANASFFPGGSVSTVNPTTGFPDYYQDQNGLKLELMEAADLFGISDPVDPLNPFSEQIGFNAEGFWWSAGASIDNGLQTAELVLALEAAFAPSEAAVDGQQSGFGRIRYRVDGLTPGESYTIRHPYGEATEIADGAGVINTTNDIGCFATVGITTCDPAKVGTGAPPLQSAGTFSIALSSGIGPFLMWDTFNIDPALTDPLLKNNQPAYSGRSYLGNPAYDHTITGSPVSQNFFEVTGSGLTNFSTNLFSVTGRLFAPLVQLNNVSFTSGALVNNTGSLEFNFTVNDSGIGSFIGGANCSDIASFPVIAGTQTGQINPTTNGSFSCDFIVTNAQGNASNPVTIPPFTFDNIAPTAPIITTSLSTSGSTITIGGTAEIDSVIKILSGATIVGTGIATGGNFSVSGVPVIEGGNTFSVTATDGAGNISTSTDILVTVDTIAPSAPVITTTNALVNTSTIDMVGTAESGSTVQVFNGVNLITSGTADINGDFSISTPLAVDGSFSITATATDAAGNTSLASSAVSIVRDTVNPIGTVVFASGVVTNQTGTTINLTSTKAGTFSTSGTGIVETVTGSLAADISALIDIVLTQGDGEKNISVLYTDIAGNTNTQTASITLDQTAPAAPVISTTNITTSGSTVTIAGTAEANSVITILNGVTVVGTGTATGGNFSISGVPIVEGANNLTATSTDAASNTSAPSAQAVTVTVDTLAPSSPVITTTGVTVNTATINIAGTAESSSTVQVFNGVNLLASGTAGIDGNFSISTPLAFDGTFTITATATDAAGNTSGASSTVSVIKDTVSPVGTVVFASGSVTKLTGTTTNLTSTKAGTFSISGAGMVGTVTGSLVANVSTPADIILTAGDGVKNISVLYTDIAGNTNTQVASIILDQTAPVAPVISTTNITTSGSTVTIAGTAEADSVIEILNGTTVIGTGIATGGNFSISSVPIVEGANNLSATATDAASNTSVTSAQAVTVTVDTVAPSAPVITTTNALINTSSINIAGTAEASSTVQVFDGVNVLTSGIADIDGNFNISTPLALDGTFTITVTATDAAGNTSSVSNTVSVTRDTVNPVGTVAFVSGAVTNLTGTTTNLTSTKAGTFSISGAGMVGTVTGSLVANVSTPADIVLTTGDGVKNISVLYTDVVGNTDTQVASIILDQTAPAAPTIPATDLFTNGTTVTLSGSGEVNSTIKIFNGAGSTSLATGTVDGSGNFTITGVPIVEGANNLSASATDVAGNEGDRSSSAVTVTVDTLAPTTPVISTPSQTTSATTITIAGTGEIPVGAGNSTTIKILNGSTVLATGLVDGSGNFSIAGVPLVEGANVLTATATDVAGNTSTNSSSITITLSGIGPVISNVSVKNITQNLADLLLEFTDNNFTIGNGTGTITIGTGGSLNNVSTNSLVIALGSPNLASISLSGLSPFTTYGFNIIVTDDAGSPGSFTGSFVTASTPITLSGTSTQTGTTTLVDGNLAVGGTLDLNGSTLTIVSDTENMLNAIQGSLTLSGITTISVGGSTWNGIIMPPSLVNSGDDKEASSSELSTLVSTNFGPGLSSTVLQTVKVGGEDNVSLIGDDGNFNVQFVVPSSSPGTILNLFRSTNGSTWELSSPDTTCTLDADKICAFDTNHLSYFAPTVIVDNIPTTLNFTALTSRPLSATETSNTLTVSGMSTGVSGNVVVANGSISVNGGAFASTGIITNGDSVQLQLTNATSNSTLVTATMSIDSTVVGTFSSTTLVASTSGSSGGSGGGGGGSSGGGSSNIGMSNTERKADTCLSGDNSPSLYDGVCNAVEKPVTTSSNEATGTEEIPDFLKGISISEIFEDISSSFENESLFETLSLNGNEGSGNFKDIDNSFAKDYILELANKGIIKGFDDGSFKPDNSITRAEYLSIVMKTLGISVDASLTETTFTDLPNEGSWMIKYLEKAKGYGIKGQVINGKSVFRPNDPITRAEAMSILLKIAEIETSSKTTTDFTDVPTMWIKYVEKAKELNIVSGQVINGKLSFRPNDSLTRAEAVKIIKKGLDNVSPKTSMSGASKSYNVDITSSGLSPQTITINKGDTVNFINKDSMLHWIASASHPTHTVYPGSGIEKCDTSEESKIFDTCDGLAKDEAYSFKFDNVGEWKYHDHLNATNNVFYGTVIVK